MSVQYSDHLILLDRYSERFLQLARSVDLDALVPSCPGWTAADLVHHLAEVQHFWASIVEGRLDDPGGVEPKPRPGDPGLADLFDDARRLLWSALGGAAPDDSCWSWSETGGTVGWVARRQHHEAAIHLADLELAAGGRPQLQHATAVDGIAEMIDVMLGEFPRWMSYEPQWLVEVEVPDFDTATLLTVGLLSGTGPESGTVYIDLPGARRAEYGLPDAIVSGPAEAMDLWLWGRGPVDDLTVTGEGDAVEALRAAIADGTQ
jgi:uncharacterized protein (TIGR03083 family)